MVRTAKYIGLGLMLALSAPGMADVKDGKAAWDRGDFAKAVKEWQQPAAAGDAEAQFNLGQAYRQGRGVKADPARAEELFQKAATTGHVRAQLLYATILKEQGKPKDAVPWLDRAANRGDPEAQYLLAIALYNGQDAPRDLVRAYGFARLAVDNGSVAAKDALAAMDKALPADVKTKGAAAATQIAANIARAKAQQEAQINRQLLAGARGGGGGGGGGGAGGEGGGGGGGEGGGGGD